MGHAVHTYMPHSLEVLLFYGFYFTITFFVMTEPSAKVVVLM